MHLGANFSAAETQIHAAEQDIFVASAFRIHAKRHIEQRHAPSFYHDSTNLRFIDAVKYAQQGRLTRAIMPDQSNAFSMIDLKGEVGESLNAHTFLNVGHHAPAGRRG